MSRPPVFKEKTFEAARSEAASLNRVLLVDFSAEWCQPCKHMDRTTWVDPSVVEWLDARAVAIQLDGDESPLAQSLNVRAYPTVIAFSGEKELDRITGARPAAALLKWLNDLLVGRTELDRLRAVPKEDLSGQLQLARALVDAGLDDEALEVFAWLWEHCLEIEPAWVGVRSSFLVGALEPLLERSARARERFGRFRDAAAAKTSRDGFSDFVTLNEVLGENGKTLEWLRAATPESAEVVEFSQEHRLRAVIQEHGEWALLGRLLKSPERLLQTEHQRLEAIRSASSSDFPLGSRERIVEHFASNFCELGQLVVRSLSAANRAAEADLVEKLARKLDPSERMTAMLREARTVT